MDKIKKEFELYLTKQGLKHTGPRQEIAAVFFAAQGHISIDDLFALARKQNNKIGYATVHRTMKLLTEAGLARELDFGEGRKRYEPMQGRAHHDHLICLKCGKLIEVLEPQIEKLQERLAKQYKFETAWHRLEIFGYCQSCS